MSVTEVSTSPSMTEAVSEEHVYLVGRPPFEEYIQFMSTEPLGAEQADLRQLADEWRVANDHIKSLQQSESIWADNPPVQPIPSSLQHLVTTVLSDPFFQRGFFAVPVELGIVELDRLVVFQKHINLGFVNRLKDQLGPKPSQEAIFRLCMPFDHPIVPFRVRQIGGNAFSFVSESEDLRVLKLSLLKQNQVSDVKTTGPIAGVVALAVGYGPNYLSVVSADDRLVLHNASHRAYALRDLGVTHAPCIIQRVSRREELNVIAAGSPLSQSPDVYLKEPRPPVLKDYFDPELRKIVRLPPKARQVRVAIGVEVSDIPWSEPELARQDP